VLLRALHEIAVALGGVLDPTELARLVADHARTLIGAEGAAVRLWDPEAGVLRRLNDTDGYVTGANRDPKTGLGASTQAILTSAPVVIQDYKNWPNALEGGPRASLHASIAVPLLLNDRAVGTLGIWYYHPHRCTKSDVETLVLLAAQVAPYLEAARLHAESEKRRAEPRL
jgi:GAF domain-containing protein